MRKRSLLFLGAAAAVCAASLLGPYLVTQPFRPQTPREVELAHLVRSLGGFMALAAAGVGAVTGVLAWRAGPGWLRKAAVAGLGAILAAAALLGRLNPTELMFAPLSRPGFVTSTQATHVSADDLVIGLQIADDARAYPVRQLAYHHLVNDVVGEQALVATY